MHSIVLYLIAPSYLLVFRSYPLKVAEIAGLLISITETVPLTIEPRDLYFITIRGYLKFANLKPNAEGTFDLLPVFF
jgi:hypothetical protein